MLKIGSINLPPNDRVSKSGRLQRLIPVPSRTTHLAGLHALLVQDTGHFDCPGGASPMRCEFILRVRHYHAGSLIGVKSHRHYF